MSAGSDFRADFYTQWDVIDSNGNQATVNVRVEHDGTQWNLTEGEILAGRHQVSASNKLDDSETVATVGSD